MQIHIDKRYQDFTTIFEATTGSYLYGTALPESDVDTRGVFIPSEKYFLGFHNRIEQIEENKQDIVHYDIRKFMALCLDCNPNIIELLFIPNNFTQIKTPEWDEIIAHKSLFLSKKARYTFTGYAISQLHRIKQHRNWLLNPIKEQPKRSNFGLPENKTLVTKDQLNAYSELAINYDKNIVEDYKLDINTLDVLQREKAYLNANKQWQQYLEWQKNRNPKRAELEAKSGYDCKHAMHCYRLIEEGKELLLTGNIEFPRPNAKILLDIRNGKYSYDELMTLIGNIDAQFDEYYEKSALPHSPNHEEADKLCISLVKRKI